ncbi:MAG: glycosyltransferase family 39 protein [Actinomycetota bacterium]|nr:glycosyltransferase family 39 protein [Actinomycetota bacterium]
MAPGRRFHGKLTELMIVILFTLAVTLPFIAKPFDMDDADFLGFAEAQLQKPLAFELHNYTFFGQQNAVFQDTHPPLISSYLAVLIKAFGSESEVPLHLAFLVFPLNAAVSMYFMSRRFTRHALLATLLLMGTPGVVVMSHNVMSDLPGLSLWLAAIALYLYGLDRHSLGLMALSALAITIGVFISYQVLSVIPLLFVYVLVRRRLSVLAVIPFILPLSSFLSFTVWQTIALGTLPRFSYGVGAPLAWYSVVQKGASAMLAIGGASIFFGVMMRVLWTRKWDVGLYFAFLVPLWFAGLFLFLTGHFTAVSAVLVILFLPLGIAVSYRLLAEGWGRIRSEWSGTARREHIASDLLLILWLTGVLFYVIFLLPYSSVRYLLPLFPPFILLFVRLVENRLPSRRAAARVLLGGFIGTTLLGLLLAAADYELALSQRNFALNQGAALKAQAQAQGHKAWFVGEFGFRYYMEKAGLKELPKNVVIPVGDLVIQSPLADPRLFSNDMRDRVHLIEIIGRNPVLPLRVTSFRSQAGFYGHFWGLLPFSLSTVDLEDYLVYQVVPPQPRNNHGDGKL